MRITSYFSLNETCFCSFPLFYCWSGFILESPQCADVISPQVRVSVARTIEANVGRNERRKEEEAQALLFRTPTPFIPFLPLSLFLPFFLPFSLSSLLSLSPCRHHLLLSPFLLFFFVALNPTYNLLEHNSATFRSFRSSPNSNSADKHDNTSRVMNGHCSRIKQQHFRRCCYNSLRNHQVSDTINNSWLNAFENERAQNLKRHLVHLKIANRKTFPDAKIIFLPSISSSISNIH